MLDKRYMLYNRILDELENDLTGIDVIYPPDNFAVDRLTRDEKRFCMVLGRRFGRKGISALDQRLIWPEPE